MLALSYSELLSDATRAEFEQIVDTFNTLWLTEHNEDGTHVTAPIATAVSEELGLPVGAILPYSGPTAPTGWLICNGAAVSRSTYSALFTVIGTTYGTGDGATTFNIPNLQQRFPLGKASSGTGDALGDTGGNIDHTHTGPSHQHTGPSHVHTGPSHDHEIAAGGTGATGAPSATTEVQAGTGATVASATHTHTGPSHDHGGDTGLSGTGDTGAAGTGNTGSAGAGNTGAANPPYLVLNYIVLYS